MARKKATASPPIVHRLPITQARVNLGAVVKRVHLNKESRPRSAAKPPSVRKHDTVLCRPYHAPL